MTRVLHVFGALERGGAETWLLSVLRESKSGAYRHDVCLLADHDGPLVGEFERLGCKTFQCPVKPLVEFPFRLYSALRAGEYDIVHSHVFRFSGLILTLARFAGVRSRIAHSHNVADGSRPSASRRLYQLAMRGLLRWNSTRGLACASPAAEGLFGRAAANGRTISILPYGIELSCFKQPEDRAKLRRSLGLPLSGRLVIHVGSLTLQKNQRFLLRVFAEARRSLPQLTLLIVGDGPLRHEIERMVRALGIADSVSLLGERDDVPRLLAAADAFILTSLYEGSPLSLLEAQASGLPSIVPSHIDSALTRSRDSVRTIGLDQPIEAWADGLVEIAHIARIPTSEAHRQLRNLGYDSATSRTNLEAIYRRQIEETAQSPIARPIADEGVRS